MKLYMNPSNLDYFEALASQTRLRIIQLLSERDMNIKELAEALEVSSSIMTKHIRKLEGAQLIATSNVSRDGNRSKICTLLNRVTEIHTPVQARHDRGGHRFHEIPMPVGLFTGIQASAPCGLADAGRILGCEDEPIYMLTPERAQAQLLWISGGYVEYAFPNYLERGQRPSALEIIGEFGPGPSSGSGDPCLSTISVSLSGRRLCSFIAPSAPGAIRGALTPAWWKHSQHGILVIIRIDKDGLFINGERKANLTVGELDSRCDCWTLRLHAGEPSETGGGLTLFGEKFGNYPQNLALRTYYV